MKKIFFFITSSIITLVITSMIVYRFVDVNDYKSNILSFVNDKTGKKISINGDIRLRILPEIAFDISDVSVSGYGDNNENLISVARIVIYPRIIPLFKREIEASSLKLVNPILKFKIFKDGTNNFTQVGIKSTSPDEVKRASFFSALDKNNIFLREFINDHIVNKFQLKSLDIENGKLRFSDEQNGIDAHVDDIFTQTSFMPGNNFFKIFGQVKLDVGINTPFSVSGQYQLAKDFYDFSTIAFKLGDIEAHGEAGIDFRSSVPDAKIAFYFENINLNPYSGLINFLIASRDASLKDENTKNDEKEPFIWSADSIDIGLLRSLNGHFSFKSNNIIYKGTNIGIVTLNSYLMNGKFTLSLKEAEMFGGNINGELVVDATSAIPKLRQKLNLEDIDLTKLSESTGIIENFGGRVNGGAMLSSRGVSQKELINNIDGSLSFMADNGFVKGIDLLGMAKNVSSAFSVGKKNEQRTSFKELSGDFDVKDGVVKTDNLKVDSDVIDFNGIGSANLPDLNINFRMMPKVKSSKDDVDVLGGMRAPILISGNLLQPSWRLEVQALVEDLVKNPKGTENLVKQIKRDFEDIKDSMKSDVKNDNNGVVKDIKKILNGF